MSEIKKETVAEVEVAEVEVEEEVKEVKVVMSISDGRVYAEEDGEEVWQGGISISEYDLYAYDELCNRLRKAVTAEVVGMSEYQQECLLDRELSEFAKDWVKSMISDYGDDRDLDVYYDVDCDDEYAAGVEVFNYFYDDVRDYFYNLINEQKS